jgi:hypothetical protein
MLGWYVFAKDFMCILIYVYCSIFVVFKREPLALLFSVLSLIHSVFASMGHIKEIRKAYHYKNIAYAFSFDVLCCTLLSIDHMDEDRWVYLFVFLTVFDVVCVFSILCTSKYYAFKPI